MLNKKANKYQSNLQGLFKENTLAYWSQAYEMKKKGL